MGLRRVLITCNYDNFASAKVIENNNGKLENVVKNLVDGKEIKTKRQRNFCFGFNGKRYWIDLASD